MSVSRDGPIGNNYQTRWWTSRGAPTTIMHIFWFIKTTINEEHHKNAVVIVVGLSKTASVRQMAHYYFTLDKPHLWSSLEKPIFQCLTYVSSPFRQCMQFLTQNNCIIHKNSMFIIALDYGSAVYGIVMCLLSITSCHSVRMAKHIMQPMQLHALGTPSSFLKPKTLMKIQWDHPQQGCKHVGRKIYWLYLENETQFLRKVWILMRTYL